MPLPPYIRRTGDLAEDRRDYQTMFARAAGAVAAPTAGLHFTPELLDRLTARGIGHATVTLHVGAGTFLPVTAEAVTATGTNGSTVTCSKSSSTASTLCGSPKNAASAST